jgi:methylated-DNA-[protein]-cysteine S-methyltransferase
MFFLNYLAYIAYKLVFFYIWVEKQIELTEIFKLYIPTEIGILEIVSDKGALKKCWFVDTKDADSDFLPEVLTNARSQIISYFEGKLQTFNLNLDPEGTEFQKKVWSELLKIPYGKTISYNDLANRLGDPKVIRAAASANGKNPLGILIPCHRVIGNDGKLVGYAGGLHRKRFLLDIENKNANGVMTLF